MYEISERVEISASHQLLNLPRDHPCGRVHGHNYIIEAAVRGFPKGPAGFVVSFEDIRAALVAAVAPIDHRSLNDFIANPTAEALASYLFPFMALRLPELYSVTVWETATSKVVYAPE